MRFADEMRKIAYELETVKCYNILQCVYCDWEKPTDAQRLRLEQAHFQKIDLSDGIHVVNIGGHIGESVKREIEYAQDRGKEILYHEM